MRTHLSHILRSFVGALSACAMCALAITLMLALYDVPRSVELAISLWAALLLAEAAVSEILIARGCSWLVYIGAHAALALFGAEKIVGATIFHPASTGFNAILRAAVYLSSYVCAYASQRPPASNAFVRLTDALILSAAFELAVVLGMGRTVNVPVLVLTMLTLVLVLAITSNLRAGGEAGSVIRGTGAGGYLVLLALLMLCLLLAAALLSLSGGHVDGLVGLLMAIWGILSRVGPVILEAFARLMMFLLPNPYVQSRQQIMHEEAPGYIGGAMEELGAAPDWVVMLFFIVIGLLIALGVAALLFALSRMKMTRMGSPAARRKVMRRSHLLDALRALIRRLASAISFEIAYRCAKKTPQGLYVLARRSGRMKRLPQKKSESPGTYLRRLHDALRAQGKASSLDHLADLLDRALYAGESVTLSGEDYRAFAAQIRTLPFQTTTNA